MSGCPVFQDRKGITNRDRARCCCHLGGNSMVPTMTNNPAGVAPAPTPTPSESGSLPGMTRNESKGHICIYVPPGGMHVCVWRRPTASHSLCPYSHPEPQDQLLSRPKATQPGQHPHARVHKHTHTHVYPKPSPIILPTLGDTSPKANQGLNHQEELC